MPTPGPCKPAEVIRKLALTYPETVEGSSCNKLSFKAGKKAFLYLGLTEEGYNVMLKLVDSYEEAEALAEKQPDHYRPGSNGWIQMEFSCGQSAPAGVMKRWIEESFRSLAPRKIVALLDDPVAAGKKGTRKKSPAAKKKAARKTTPRK